MGDEGRDVGQGEVPVVSFNAAVADINVSIPVAYELELTTVAQLVHNNSTQAMYIARFQKAGKYYFPLVFPY